MDILFLPGAGGDPGFWQPVAEKLPAAWRKHRLGWPGLGNQPHDPAINSLNDLTALAARHLPPGSKTAVVAQSMGGIVAVKLALAFPERISHLVLCVTSGGIPLAPYGVADWRPAYRQAFPKAAAWIMQASADHTADLPGIGIPALLLWGDADPISPPAVGQRLAELLQHAELHILPGADHDLAQSHAAKAAELIAAHLERLR